MRQALRPYQLNSLAMLKDNLRAGVKAQVLQLAVGGGKTSIASAVMQGAYAKGNRAFFIVDSLELVDQAAARFIADGLPVGVIQGNHEMTDYSKHIQVATIQTLRKRWQYIHDKLKPAVLVIDECHVLHAAHEEIIGECKKKGIPVIGLSATPFRKGLGKTFEKLVVGATTATLTDGGYLVPAICYAPFVPDLKGVKTNSSGDWIDDALAELMGDADIVGDVVENWLRLAEGRQTIVFAANVAHSRLLNDAFQLRGIKSAHIDGYERDTEVRTGIINDFRAGKINVLCNVAVLTKGFDAPDTSCIVMARPTKSLMMHIQCIGRGLRTAPGKQNCIVIDHAGNCLRNGLPTADLPNELDDGNSSRNLDRKEREKKAPIESPCKRCGHVSVKHKCPLCGFAAEARKDVEVINGELYEITETIKEKWAPSAVAALYSELLGYAKEKGYSSGWAWHKCREFAGRAPKATTGISSVQPSEKTRQIIRHLNIKSAKRQAA